MKRFYRIAVILALLSLLSAPTSPSPPRSVHDIKHIIVIYMENRSFDHLFHGFPGADTAANARYDRQSNGTGGEYQRIEIPPGGRKNIAAVENAPFLIDSQYSPEAPLPDPLHRFYQNQWQINGGRNDRFVLHSAPPVQGLVMGYYESSKTALWRYAKEFTLCDRFFMGAFGGSFLNHQWLIAARTPLYSDAPAELRVKNTEVKDRFRDGAVTPDGYAVNTMFPEWATPLHPSLPPQEAPTIGDRLTENHVTWSWYSQGWNAAVKDLSDAFRDPSVQFSIHHLPFVYYRSCSAGTSCFRDNLKDREDLLNDIRMNRLPHVAFYKPGDALDQHPSDTPQVAHRAVIDSGDREVDFIVSEIRKNQTLFRECAIIITYDENGGFWDHVAPPNGDRWGPGNRVPTVIVSPFAKRGFVDHAEYDTTSILKFIELRFGLNPLGGERKNAGNLLNAFQFDR